MRTDVRAIGWRADIANVIGAIRDHPFLLVLGMLGFSLRGGIVLLIVPILVLPTAVEVRFLLGDSLGSRGLTPGFFLLVAALSAAALAAALFALYALARIELASFTRFVNAGGDTGPYGWLPPGRLVGDARGGTTTRLFVVEAFALLAILLCAVPGRQLWPARRRSKRSRCRHRASRSMPASSMMSARR